MGKRVIFTGGSGKAGRHVIPELLKKGHQVLNLDLETPDQPNVYTLKTDLTQPGQVFNALCGQFKLSSPNPPGIPPTPDAVIHFAGMARNMLCSVSYLNRLRYY
jgi:nucleoside-diphosphate-sugar epimerase